MYSILTQLIGFMGTAVYFCAFQGKKRETILICQSIASTLFVIHFIMLGAFSGAAMNFLVVTRALIFYFRGSKKWADSIAWLPIFILLSVGVVVITWEGWISILPMIGMVSTTFAQFSKKPMLVRLLTLPNCPCWLIYNGISGSISGVITEILIAVSIIIGFLRHDVKRDKKA